MSKIKNLNDRGFIRIIVLIIVVLVILSIYGYNPQVLWVEYILPVILFIWGIIVWIVNFLVGLIKAAIAAVGFLLNLIRSIGE